MREKEARILTLPCPRCGKKPKIINLGYNQDGMGGYVKIRCKPFLQKSHIEVIGAAASYNRALNRAVENWNYEVNYAKVMGGK